MKHLELHILQSFPVSCLNRDDLNSPKTAVFGGVQRARVSSQAWKRAIRELARESSPSMGGLRTRLVVGGLVPLLRSRGFPEEASVAVAELAAEQLSNIDSKKKDAQGFNKVTTLCFLSKQEFESIADAMAAKSELRRAAGALDKLLGRAARKENDKKEEKEEIKEARAACQKQITRGEVAKAMKAVQLKDAADIALFGRMVANDHSLTVEGATMFSHALSTHKVDNEIDFFSALDDLQPKQDPAAAITSTLEFNSATYYRFAAVNLDMLRDDGHLAVLGKEDRQKVVRAFIRATLEALPAARRNSMNGNTRPGYVLGVVRKAGHPIQLVNAFESPLRSAGGKGLLAVSVDALKAEYERLNTTWALKDNELVNSSIPDKSLSQFLDEVVSHVD